ncbi:MAG: lipase family protein [Nostoc sp.]|uniref:lipase family protein n=1 Tax=Nostoc sp. TaxID=1180 RepID=UPI002FFAAD6D
MTSLPDANNQIERTDIAFFDSNYKEFDSLIAQELAALIQKVYEQFDEINKPILSEQFDEINKPKLGGDYHLISELKENGLPFGFVASKNSSNDVFVVFRGTKTFAEWFKDVNIPLVSYSDGRNLQGSVLRVIGEKIQLIQSPIEIPKVGDFGRVTVGFRQIYISLRDGMINALKGCDPNSRIFVTGHSLGSALATLAIPDILANTDFKPEKVILYTFASPRCGDREFATKFQAMRVRHWRIANTEDFVTMIPFPTGNVFKATAKLPKDEEEKAIGSGEVTSKDGKPKNPNPLFGFFKAMYNRSGEILDDHKRRMPDYVHTGTPVCFTIHAAALEQHHNLEEIYMRGILRFTESE